MAAFRAAGPKNGTVKYACGLIFSAGLAQESLRDLAAVILGAVWGGGGRGGAGEGGGG